MCGIVCYAGQEKCDTIIYDALKHLEYRGYDSAGIAVIEDNQIRTVKVEGKLEGLKKLIEKENFNGTTGIGHTRWATHGKPTQTNAHPHVVDGIAVVHNGILENHTQLRKELEEDGAVFSSETDTEILAHLISRNLKNSSNLAGAVKKSLKKVTGSYAVAILSVHEPDRIVVAKNASPLVIGLGREEIFAASDIPAILQHTNQVVFMHEKEIAVLDSDGYEIETLDGKEVRRASKTIKWSAVQAEKDGYKHFMLKEIHEQPRALEDTLRGRVSRKSAEVASELIGIDDTDAKRIRRIVLVACGTSYNAACVGRYWLESLAHIPTQVELASEYRARDPLVDPNDLVIAVSQSGETLDTLEAIKVAKKSSCRILAIANVVDSAIPRASDGALYTHAGPEIGVASTKCFTTQLAALFMLALFLGRRRQSISHERAAVLIDGLMKIPFLMRKILGSTDHIAKIARKYITARDFLFLGRNLSFPIAMEGALKLKEISYIHAEGYAAGEMKHGPIALIDEKMPVVVIMPSDSSISKIHSNFQEALARDAKMIAITTRGEELASDLAGDIIYVPGCLPELTPFLTVLPVQLIAYHMADFKGTDVDQPRNLAKTVTVE